MKQFKSETIIISKQAWFFLQNHQRLSRGGKAASESFLERAWNVVNRNDGANPATHPINENEIRIDKDNFGKLETVKSVLTEKGFGYRQDGFVVEGFNL